MVEDNIVSFDRSNEDIEALGVTSSGKISREMYDREVDSQVEVVSLSTTPDTVQTDDTDYYLALRGVEETCGVPADGNPRSRESRRARGRRRPVESPSAHAPGEKMSRALSRARARSQTRENEAKPRSRSRTPPEQRSNSVEELRREKMGTTDSLSKARPGRSRSISGVRDGDLLRCRSSYTNETTDDRIEGPPESLYVAGDHRSRSKSATRDGVRRSRSKVRANKGRKTRPGSREPVIEVALVKEDRKDPKRQQRERSKSRARRSQRKNGKGSDPECSTKKVTSPTLADTVFTGNSYACQVRADPDGAQVVTGHFNTSHVRVNMYDEGISSGSADFSEFIARKIESPSKSPPDPSGILWSNESLYFSNEDLPTTEMDNDPRANSRHSVHRKRTMTAGPPVAKVATGKTQTVLSLSHSTHSRSNRKPQSPLTFSPSVVRSSIPPELMRRKTRVASFSTNTPSRRKKSLSTTKIEGIFFGRPSKDAHVQDALEITGGRRHGSHKVNDGQHKAETSYVRPRSKHTISAPTRCTSHANQKNMITSQYTNENDDKDCPRSRKSFKPHVTGTKLEELVERVKDHHSGTSDETNPFEHLHQSHEETGLNTFGTTNPCSVLGCDPSFTETVSAANLALPGIFSHLNRSAGTISTQDLATTLGPFLPDDHPLASLYITDQDHVDWRNVSSSQSEHFPSNLGLLDATLDSAPRASRVSAPSLCSTSIHPNRLANSLVDSPYTATMSRDPSTSQNIEQSPSASTGTARGPSVALDKILPSSFPPSLDALLSSMPGGFSSSLPEPSICPSQSPSPINGAVQERAQPSTMAGEERVSPSTTPPTPLDSNIAVPQKSVSGNLYGKDKSILDFDAKKHTDYSFDPSLAFDGYFDAVETKESIGQVSKHSCMELSELLPSSEHVKLHRASGGVSSADIQGVPGYLQLDFQALGCDGSSDEIKKTDRIVSSRHISLRKSLANFRKKPGHESLLGNCE
jgi:hypothetical protein